ncbi:zwei Ig domain protein zig-8-like [Penaeus japonicus]|uniref:zwei Ig domain protein zig-8-like n=1 Tax=Penaeus japonicus TaxID=27405 RepID=UPI001C70D33E|nr:zwei Ig domain protein zig-8-like [Penaeus japonicus]
MGHLLYVVVLTAILCHFAGVVGRRHGGVIIQGKQRRRDLVLGPRAATLDHVTVEQQNNTEVVAQVGGTATIKCYTHFLGDEMVTWLKRDEEHLLTAGGQVYSSEQRYSVSHVRHQQLWELSVRDVRLSDAGIYECQMTSHPPSSLFFYLRVVEAQAVIQGAPDVHVHTGVSLKLHCAVELATEPPLYIFWFHNDSMINYAPKRPLKVMKHNFASSLVINNVTWDDAGSYRCEPHKAKAANLTLHVVEGEKHAALHNGQGEGKEEQPGASSASGFLGEKALVAATCLCMLLCNAHLGRLAGETNHRMKLGEGQEKRPGEAALRCQRKGATTTPLITPVPVPMLRHCVSNKEVLCC